MRAMPPRVNGHRGRLGGCQRVCTEAVSPTAEPMDSASVDANMCQGCRLTRTLGEGRRRPKREGMRPMVPRTATGRPHLKCGRPCQTCDGLPTRRLSGERMGRGRENRPCPRLPLPPTGARRGTRVRWIGRLIRAAATSAPPKDRRRSLRLPARGLGAGLEPAVPNGAQGRRPGALRARRRRRCAVRCSSRKGSSGR